MIMILHRHEWSKDMADVLTVGVCWPLGMPACNERRGYPEDIVATDIGVTLEETEKTVSMKSV